MAAKQPQAQRATLTDLLKKPARTKEVTVRSVDDGGNEVELTIVFRSIGSRAYDALLTKHPATREQKKDGHSWNIDTFPPALIAASSSDPQISHEDAVQLWESDDWSSGELMGLFVAAMKLNGEGLDVPFTSGGSE